VIGNYKFYQPKPKKRIISLPTKLHNLKEPLKISQLQDIILFGIEIAVPGVSVGAKDEGDANHKFNIAIASGYCC
jgi:hypothetical protein